MSYDDVVDQQFTLLQQSTENFFAKLDIEAKSPAATYGATKDFYVSSEAALRTLTTRVGVQQKSQVVLGQITELQSSLDDLKKLHIEAGERGLSHIEIVAARNGIESEFTSIFALQTALKTRLKTTAPTLK